MIRRGGKMTKIRILPIILAAMLSVGANATAFSATAYAAEPVCEEDTGKAEEQFEDEEHPETADRPEIADQATEAVETVKHPEAADRPEDEEASGSAAQETAAAKEEPE